MCLSSVAAGCGGIYGTGTGNNFNAGYGAIATAVTWDTATLELATKVDTVPVTALATAP